jgi:hypothetical protein
VLVDVGELFPPCSFSDRVINLDWFLVRRSVGVAVRLHCHRRALAWKTVYLERPLAKLIGYDTDVHRCYMVNVDKPCQRHGRLLEGSRCAGV